jgi:Nif-specific regulatory protein
VTAADQELIVELERNNANLRALLEASQAVLASSLEPDAVFEEVIRQAATVLDCESASLLLLDKKKNELVFQIALGPAGRLLRGRTMRGDRGIAGKVVQTGLPVIENDVAANEDFAAEIDARTRRTTHALLAAPLQHGGEILGVVEVLNPRREGGFSEQDAQLLQVFTNLGAVALHNARAFARATREYRAMHDSWMSHPKIVGRSPSLKSMLEGVQRVAKANTSVLIEGETGTGKELLARLIHDESPRAARPFVAINCATLAGSLLESELFGHEKGSFTGADRQRQGRFELADGGTLFLDEIGEMNLETQPKLLRVLQEREFVRLGGSETIRCDVRVVAATNRDLKARAAAGDFREDLYYRLNVFPIQVPPLRERIDDVPLLVEFFVREIAPNLGVSTPRVGAEAIAALMRYRWPGNIRELRNVVERCLLLSDGEITRASLPRDIADAVASDVQPIADAPQEDSDPSTLAKHERALILKALQDANWNQSAAARNLGIGRDHLRYRVKKYAIERPRA